MADHQVPTAEILEILNQRAGFKKCDEQIIIAYMPVLHIEMKNTRDLAYKFKIIANLNFLRLQTKPKTSETAC